ncbi:MAG: hypothetical protein ACOX15_02780 [Tepidanaerobacteraceae bacterium]
MTKEKKTDKKIPWMNNKEQPDSSADLLPICFFQLISIDEEDENENQKTETHNEDADSLNKNVVRGDIVGDNIIE